MADTKISALTASTTPLAGTEVLPIVQSGVTKQVSVANLTTGRAISATQLTLTTGSVIVANGQGIDFSDTSGAGTSELLNDYEEGTWTPSFTGSSSNPTVTYTEQSGIYTKIGRQVTIFGTLRWSAYSGGTGTLRVSGLPFASALINGVDWYPGTFSDSRSNTNWSTYTQLSLAVQAGQSFATINILKDSANQTTIGHATVGASGVFKFTASYFV
jgi:hypothetical protein